MIKHKENELRELLLPYVHTFTERKYDVERDDIESLIRFASSSGVLDIDIEEAKHHAGKGYENRPNAFWEFLKLIPDGVPPGQEDILEDLENDAED